MGHKWPLVEVYYFLSLRIKDRCLFPMSNLNKRLKRSNRMKIKNRKTEKNNGKKRSLIITNFVIVVVSGNRPNATQKPKR